MKKNKFLVYISTILFLGIIGIIIYFHYSYKYSILYNNNLNKINIGKLKQIYSYLTKNYSNNFPYPQGDTILLDKDNHQIHLDDNKINLEKINNLTIIQGNICSLEINDNTFQINTYDSRFSSGDNKKCFSYAVTKDHQKFQLGTIIYQNKNYVSYLTGNISGSITKDYLSNNLVINNGNKYLPYAPLNNNKIIIILTGNVDNLNIEENSKINLEIIDYIKLKEDGLELPTNNKITNIRLFGEGKNFLFKIIFPNGTIIFLSPNKDGKIDYTIRDFKYNNLKSEGSIINGLGKTTYNLVKMGSNSDINLQDNKGGLYVIKGTKFTIEVDTGNSSTYLAQGNIELFFTNSTKNYILNTINNLISYDNNNKVDDIFKTSNKIGKLYSQSIANDILINSNINYQNKKSNLTLKNDKNSELYKLLNENKDLKIQDIYNIENGSGNTKYQLILFKGFFAKNFHINISEKDKSYNLNEKLNKICLENNFQSAVDLDNIYQFLSLKSIGINISFDKNENLNSILPENYILLIKNKNKKFDNFNITFFNNSTYQLGNSHIMQVGKDSAGNDHEIKGIGLICIK